MKQIRHPSASFFVTKEQSAVTSGTSNYISGSTRTIVKGTSRVNAIKQLGQCCDKLQSNDSVDKVSVNIVSYFDLTLFRTRCNGQELYVNNCLIPAVHRLVTYFVCLLVYAVIYLYALISTDRILFDEAN